MSKGNLLRSLVLLQAVLRLRLLAAQIRGEFLCQDPIRRPSLMLSHVRDELNSADAARTFTGEVLNAEEVFSGDGYSSGDEEVLLGDEHARDPDDFVDEAEGEWERISLLSGQDVDVEASNNSEEHASNSGDVQCPECGKHFKNDKSMFGHLRSHPNRGYKGATPPAKPKMLSNRSVVASSGSSSPVDNRPATRYNQRDPRLDTYDILAAYVMLTLKCRDNQAAQQAPLPSHPCSKRKHGSIELDIHGEESIMSKAGADTVLCNGHGSTVAEIAGNDAVLRNKYGSSVVEVAGADAVLRDERGSPAVEVLRKRGRKKYKEGREAHNKEKDVPSVKEKRPYICKHCKAEFPTHQALGGHMAAHNKDKRIQAQNEQEAGKAYEGKIDRSLNGHKAKCDGDEHGRDGVSLSSKELLVKCFSMMFNKGSQSRQELGGYMRQHIKRKDGGSPPVAAASTADGDRPRPSEIDLNVEAPEQE